jgi:hypothetical protein
MSESIAQGRKTVAAEFMFDLFSGNAPAAADAVLNRNSTADFRPLSFGRTPVSGQKDKSPLLLEIT